MDMNQFRKHLANKSSKRLINESLPKHTITGVVADARPYRVPLQGYYTRVYVDVTRATPSIKTDWCMISVYTGSNKTVFKKGEMWQFETTEDALSSLPNTPAFQASSSKKLSAK